MAIDFFSLALSKQYTEDTSDALGAVKGAPCTIKSIEKSDGGSLITFEWTGTSGKTETSTLFVKDGKDGVNGLDGKDGSTGRDGRNGSDGKDGTDGVGISKIEKINTQGLIDTYRITFTNEVTFDYEITNGKDGKDGEYSSGNSNNGSIVESHTHENKEVLDIITSDKITEWNNKSEFDGSYNSLTDTPTDFPTVNGHTVESNVPKNAVFTDTVYDDSVVKSRLSTIENTCLTKNEIESSIETAKQEAITSILGGTVEEDFDTLKEVATWILADQTNSAELINRVTEIEKHYLKGADKIELQQMIGNLQTFVGELPTESTSTTVIQYIQEVVGDLNIGNYALVSDLTSLTQRVIENTNLLSQLEDKKAEQTQVNQIVENVNIIQNTLDELGDLSVKDVVSETDLDEELILKVNDICTTSDLTLRNSKDGGVKLNYMVGKTEQKQYSGKNLLNIKELISVTTNNLISCNVSENDLSFTVSTELDGYQQYIGYMDIEKYIGKTLTFSIETYSSSNSLAEPRLFLEQFTEDSTNLTKDVYVSVFSGVTKTITILENAKLLRLIFRANQNSSTFLHNSVYTFGNIQIEEGKETTDYEPFTGGQPSPSQQYPQSLNHTGDCVGMMQGYYNVSNNGAYINSPVFICNKYAIPCKVDDKIHFNFEDTLYCRMLYFKGDTYVSTSVVEKVKTGSFTVPNDVDNFKYYLYPDGSAPITPETVGKIELTVNDKYVVQIVEYGKNFFKYNKPANTTKNGVSITYNDDGSITLNGTCEDWFFVNLNYIANSRVLPNGKYTLVNTNISGCFFSAYIDGIRVDATIANVSFELTDNNTSDHIRYEVTKGTVLNNVTIYPLVMLDNETDLTYEPYTEHVATFYMDEPLRDGDRIVQIDELLQVERKNKRILLKDLTWSQYLAHKNVFQINLKDCLIGFQTSKCTHFTNVNGAWDLADVAYSDHNENTIKYFATKYNTLDDWVAWINENNPVLEYTLATPTYEVLDNQSQIALNSLKSFNGVTHIEINSRVQPQEVSFDYGTSRVGAITLKNELRENTRDIKMKELESKYEELVALISGGNSGEPTEPVDLGENGETGETGETESVEPTTE